MDGASSIRFSSSAGLFVALGVLTLGISAPASASYVDLFCSPTNQGGVKCNDNNLVSGSQVDNAPVDGSYSFHYVTGSMNSLASYEGGAFSLTTVGSQRGPVPSARIATPRGILTLDDLYIAGGTPGDVISVSVNIDLAGSYDGSGTQGGVAASLNFWLTANQTGGVQQTYGGALNTTESFSGSASVGRTGSASGLAAQIAGGDFIDAFDTTLITPTFDLIVGETFSLTLDAAMQGTWLPSYFGYVGLSWNIDTISFLNSGLLNIGPGYTLESVGGAVTNNQLLPIIDPVPAPGALALLGFGLLGLAGRRQTA